MAATHQTPLPLTPGPRSTSAGVLALLEARLHDRAAQHPKTHSLQASGFVSPTVNVKAAEERFGLPADTPVISCYDAGRDGFWLHHFLTYEGITSVVDSASIEVHRRIHRARSGKGKVTRLVTHRVPTKGFRIRGSSSVPQVSCRNLVKLAHQDTACLGLAPWLLRADEPIATARDWGTITVVEVDLDHWLHWSRLGLLMAGIVRHQPANAKERWPADPTVASGSSDRRGQ